MNHLIDFIEAYYSTPAIYILLEFIAFVFGIISVVYAKMLLIFWFILLG